MQPLELTPSAQRLVINLGKPAGNSTPDNQTIHVADIGATFYFAYEQLRNIAENREHHLLLRSAIERYLWRYVRLDQLEPFAHDLIVELTQAGYLKNGTVRTATADTIDRLMDQLVTVLGAARQHTSHHADTTKWLFQYASVKIESLINPDPRTTAFMQFAYEHYLTAIDKPATVGAAVADQDYRIALFCAIQSTIFKSDQATTRFHCLNTSLGDLTPRSATQFLAINQLIDDHYHGQLANRLGRLIGRYGAPMRILRELVFDGSGAAGVLQNRSQAIAKTKLLCATEYQHVHDQLRHRIVRSIIFVLITKTLIGIAVEIPYDLAVYGFVAWPPLLINILFPPLYMATLGARVHTPSAKNTEVIAGLVDRIIYAGAGAPIEYRPRKRRVPRGLNVFFNTIYALGFIGSVAAVALGLRALGFNLVNGIIFFVFFSAVSFLGLRLRRLAHELQLLDEHPSLLQSFVDFLSAPFIAMGHWLSDKYSKANIVTLILDAAIEMPFKTFIRLARQWIRFLRDKQDEL